MKKAIIQNYISTILGIIIVLYSLFALYMQRIELDIYFFMLIVAGVTLIFFPVDDIIKIIKNKINNNNKIYPA